MSDRRHSGLVVAVAAAVVSGFAVFLNGVAVRRFDDATVYTTAKNLVAGCILLAAVMATSASRAAQVDERHSGSSARPPAALAVIAVIGGSVPFVLFFEGLARATSTHGAFIHKTLIVWVAVGATVVLKERVTIVHAAAVGILLVGFGILGGGSPDSFGSGELMILAATLLWAAEVVLVKTLLPTVPSLTAATVRMAGGSLLLIAWVAVRGRLDELTSLSASQWAWLVATGVTLSAFVATWYRALALSPAIDVTAVLVLGAVITGVLDIGLRDAPVTANSSGYLLLVVAGAAVALAQRRTPTTR